MLIDIVCQDVLGVEEIFVCVCGLNPNTELIEMLAMLEEVVGRFRFEYPIKVTQIKFLSQHLSRLNFFIVFDLQQHFINFKISFDIMHDRNLHIFLQQFVD